MKKCTGKSEFEAVVVVGCSAGGIEALTKILPTLPGDLAFPVLIVQHIPPESDGF